MWRLIPARAGGAAAAALCAGAHVHVNTRGFVSHADASDVNPLHNQALINMKCGVRVGVEVWAWRVGEFNN